MGPQKCQILHPSTVGGRRWSDKIGIRPGRAIREIGESQSERVSARGAFAGAVIVFTGCSPPPLQRCGDVSAARYARNIVETTQQIGFGQRLQNAEAKARRANAAAGETNAGPRRIRFPEALGPVDADSRLFIADDGLLAA